MVEYTNYRLRDNACNKSNNIKWYSIHNNNNNSSNSRNITRILKNSSKNFFKIYKDSQFLLLKFHKGLDKTFAISFQYLWRSLFIFKRNTITPKDVKIFEKSLNIFASKDITKIFVKYFQRSFPRSSKTFVLFKIH